MHLLVLGSLWPLPRGLGIEQLFQFVKKDPDFRNADPVWRVAGVEITAEATERLEIVEDLAKFTAGQCRATQVGRQHANAMPSQYGIHDAIDVVEQEFARDRHADFLSLGVDQSPYSAFVELQQTEAGVVCQFVRCSRFTVGGMESS